jgi:hypothetical protein
MPAHHRGQPDGEFLCLQDQDHTPLDAPAFALSDHTYMVARKTAARNAVLPLYAISSAAWIVNTHLSNDPLIHGMGLQ